MNDDYQGHERVQAHYIAFLTGLTVNASYHFDVAPYNPFDAFIDFKQPKEENMHTGFVTTTFPSHRAAWKVYETYGWKTLIVTLDLDDELLAEYVHNLLPHGKFPSYSRSAMKPLENFLVNDLQPQRRGA